MTQKRAGSVTINDARIIFRNFAGVEGQYNAAGDRNFGVVLDPATAEAMLEDGWNVKYLKSRDEGDEPTPWVPVSVSFAHRPPRVVMISQRYDHATGEFVPSRVTLPEELIEMLDIADLSTVDLRLNPYTWNVNGRTGVKAYLGAIYATVQQDELERKYAAIPEIDIAGAPLQITAGGEVEDMIEGEVLEDDMEELQIEG